MNERNSIGAFVFTEIAVSFLVGGAPILIAFNSAGVEGIGKMLSSLLPTETLVWYSFALTGVAMAVDFANRFFLKTTDLGNAIWDRLDDIGSQISPSIQTVLRIAAGVTLTFVSLWAIADYENFRVAQLLYLIALGVIALIEAAALRWAQVWLAKKWVRRRPSAAF